MLNCLPIKSLCFVFLAVCISDVFAESKHVCKCVCFFFAPRQLVLDYESKEINPLSCCWNSRMMTGLRLSSLRWRVLSNKVRLHCLSAVYSSRMINYLISHLRFIQWGWITPLADFLCILTSHTHTHTGGETHLAVFEIRSTFKGASPPLWVQPERSKADASMLSFLNWCFSYVQDCFLPVNASITV